MTGVDQSYGTARRVAIAGIGVSGLLACSNVIIGMLAHSTSVIATGFEFAGDVIASIIVVIGMGVAARPADDDHPYGDRPAVPHRLAHRSRPNADGCCIPRDCRTRARDIEAGPAVGRGRLGSR
jgi:hypothetical protein